MRSQRSILSLRYTPVSVVGGVRKAVGGFLRYVQFRDQHSDLERVPALDAYVRYVAHRDRTSPGGRVFGQDGARTEGDRKRLVDFVARSTKGLEPMWVVGRNGKRQDRQRAVYSLVLSPEDWRGLDLRTLARTAMEQLERDAGPAGIGPWLAAEHRNTKHHHVHVVLAARREVSPGRFSTLVVNRPRLQRMKDAIAQEIERQRGEYQPEPVERKAAERIDVGRESRQIRTRHSALRWRLLPDVEATRYSVRAMASRGRHAGHAVAWYRMHMLAAGYRRRMERELKQESERAEREGWVR